MRQHKIYYLRIMHTYQCRVSGSAVSVAVQCQCWLKQNKTAGEVTHPSEAILTLHKLVLFCVQRVCHVAKLLLLLLSFLLSGSIFCQCKWFKLIICCWQRTAIAVSEAHGTPYFSDLMINRAFFPNRFCFLVNYAG